MMLKHFENLSNNYLELLNDKEDFNIIINVSESTNTKTFQAHLAILNIGPFIFELTHIAYEFLLEYMAKDLENYLIETKSSWLHLHFSRIYNISFQNNKFYELQTWCNNNIVKHPDKFFNSENFTILKENALGIVQNSDLLLDIKNWTNENFLALKNTLKNCLSHIHYFQISVDDINDNIQPYQQILEKNLWNDISIKFMSQNRQISSIILPPHIILILTLPTRITEQFSLIISEIHVAEIASWVDRKDNAYSVTNNLYKFKLLLCITRDGFTYISFWKYVISKHILL
ncbi:kelch-like protein 17 [Gigaspora margarita]|uniref:Kelch-like protein 17 n=1 Tax=Gigaspora margarita TaxID=4874 RepID=A0A8H3XF35_GIGMA|nr:kelch-like protein 17 [Gigaspora margarita]